MLALLLAIAGLAGEPAPQLKPLRSKAMQEGLVWLARHQNPDGSWGGGSLAKLCKGARACCSGLELGGHADSGLTGLALLAFLRSGCDPLSKRELVDPIGNRRFVAGDVVTRGLRWLQKIQKPDGGYMHDEFSPIIYNEAAAEIAMAEASVLEKSNEDWRTCARRGVEFLQAAQRKSPDEKGLWGWRYFSRVEVEKDKQAKPEVLHDADISATGWAVAGLAAAARAGLEVRKDSLDGALEFMNSVAVTTGLVGYDKSQSAGLKVQGPDDRFDYHCATLSAIGILIRLRTTKDTTDAFLDAAAQKILEDQPRVEGSGLSIDYYYWYHASEALKALEGTEYAKGKKRKPAEPWNKSAGDRLFALQDHTKDSCSFGGWVTRDRWAYLGGPVYCTAMAVLTLKLTDGK